jgi:hypothetical protein
LEKVKMKISKEQLKKKAIEILINTNAVVIFVSLTSKIAEAKQIADAASSYKNTATTVATTVGVAGLAAGGVMHAIPGLGNHGKKVLVGGLIALVCGVGGDTASQTIQSIFQ